MTTTRWTLLLALAGIQVMSMLSFTGVNCSDHGGFIVVGGQIVICPKYQVVDHTKFEGLHAPNFQYPGG